MNIFFILASVPAHSHSFSSPPQKLEAKSLIKLNFAKNNDGRFFSEFRSVLNDLHSQLLVSEKAKLDPGYHLNSTNLETRETLAELYKDYKGDALLASTMKEPQAKKTDKLNAAHYSTGRVSASFTSTAMTPATEHTAGYISTVSSSSSSSSRSLSQVPKAGENFTKLCKKGYYDGTVFHRSIRNFMIQGGDPTGTGLGKFRPYNLSKTLTILECVVSFPSFITFRSCPYLDRKHTVFGRVVGGFEALTAMENIEADPKTDKPKSEIKLLSATVFVDPYEEADAQIAAERQKEFEKQEEERAQTSVSQRKTRADQGPKTFKAGIGKYINPATTTTTKRPAAEDSGPSTSGVTSGTKKAKGKTGFGDFSSW
uniref:Peptidylprolyl isomerase (cyclophilin)-like 2 n=1 Tax=Hucho hucho TaxID=62062 RepID=A0A4W5PND4_9TELE